MIKFKGTIDTISFLDTELKVIQDSCGVIAEHGLNECNVSAVYTHHDSHFTYFLTFVSEGHKRDYESDHPHLKEQWSTPKVPNKWPFAMKTRSNPWSPDATYSCSDCGLEWEGEAIGYIAAGTNYANGEWAPCPNCGHENDIDRGNDDD